MGSLKFRRAVEMTVMAAEDKAAAGGQVVCGRVNRTISRENEARIG